MVARTLNSPEILLVEDNPHDAELTRRALEHQHVANRVVVVEDGADALDLLFCRGAHRSRDIKRPPALVLLDLKLPKVNGLEVIKAIKRDERTRSIPVVMLTSSREDPDIKRAYELGVNSYVVKPMEFEAFSDSVAKLGLYWLLLNQPPT
jgi:two-component system, response regulator